VKSFLLFLMLLLAPRPVGAVPSPPDTVTLEPAANGAEDSPPEETPASPTTTGTPGLGDRDEGVDLLPPEIIPWQDSMLALPEWTSPEQEEITYGLRPANQGGGLFPPQIWALQPTPEAGLLLHDIESTDAAAPVASQDEPALVPLGLEQMALYTGQKPTTAFVDPQHFVKGRPAAWMESLVKRWLNEQCAFHTTMLVFGKDQLLPADFDPQALRKQWFAEDEDALLVLYFYHQPERTLAIFGPKARTAYSEDLLRSTIEAAVTETGRVAGAEEQMERFCYKMSVRLHWLSRLRIYPALDGAPGLPANQGLEPSRKAVWLVLGGAVLMAAGVLATSWLRRRQAGRAARGDATLLPEAEHLPRFGAPHCGGFSSVITFVGTTPVS
jgi:hypothetical protein